MKIRATIILKTIFSVFLFVSVFFNNTYIASANTDDICDPPRGVFGKLQVAWESLDIRKTIVNMFTSAAMDVPASFLANGDAADIFSCSIYIRGLLEDSEIDTSFMPDEGDCSQYDEAYCASLVNSYQNPDTRSGYLNTTQNARVKGSLVGMSNILENGLQEPVPVSLAYFWNRQVEPIPFMGKALAQAPDDYSGPFLPTIYVFWKAFRNAAFGAMAIIMIIVGIMIMTRKKLDPRTAVTVQYAVPRVLLALVLITFSYPIGAVFVSFGWSLANSADNMIRTLILAPEDLGTFGQAIMIGAYSLKGGISAVLLILTMILVLILWIMAMFKVLSIYIKMLISIIGAPIIFTYGAIPGKGEVTTNWFKKMGVNVLSLFAIYLSIGLTHAAISVLFASISNQQNFLTGFFAALIGNFLLYFIAIYGYNYARKVPNKIEDAILGKKR